MRIVTVGELARYVKDLMSEDYNLQDVWAQGEISNYTQSVAGHRYFSLKDETATLRCVFFGGRGRAPVGPPLRNGMAVLAHGRVSFYEQRGDLQLYVDAVEPAGIGELHLRFEALKRRLEAEGLFDEARKRPLPVAPLVIGVVTSLKAAALRDILRTLRLRCPLARVILAGAAVQGDGAGEQVAAAIDALNAQGEAQVIVVARGGGSIEELWAFNEEEVARAIARSRAPVVTGVGHETDFTIADFVADARAATPTAAAALAAPDADQWREGVRYAAIRMGQLIEARLADEADALHVLRRRLDRASPSRRIADDRQRIDDAHAALALRMGHLLALQKSALQGKAQQLHALSPLQTLARGFAVIRRQPDDALVTSVAHVRAGQGLTVRLSDGVFAATAGPRLATQVPDATANATHTARDAATGGQPPGSLWRERAQADG
ncbi:MAG TPA: exodeoxyribonuclease VII large subunit [Ktedonobacterales bacterium]|nr:exodeoxyribonuclease VII large subunit [Ktedonobacterales bacterium]